MKWILLFIFITIADAQTNFWEPTASVGCGFGQIQNISFSTTGHIYLAVYDSGVYRSTNNGSSWLKLSSLPESKWQSVFVHPADILFATGQSGGYNGIFRSSDDGSSWQFIKTSTVSGGMDFILDGSGNIIVVGNGVEKSTDNGTTWSNSGVGISSGSQCYSITKSLNNTLFVGNSNGVYKSTNNGLIWVPALLSGIQINHIWTWGEQNVYAATEGNGIWRSTDNGANWDITGTGIKGYYKSVIKTPEGILFTGTNNYYGDNGVFKSTDDGNTWSMLNDGFTAVNDSNIRCLGLNPNGYLFVVTYGTFINSFFINNVYHSQQTVTDISDIINKPEECLLLQNYPNPFNPNTMIKYELPVESSVKLKIFDVLGREIATLFDGIQAPGSKSANWDSKDSFGRNVGSGIYFYKLEITSLNEHQKVFTKIRKMLLIK